MKNRPKAKQKSLDAPSQKPDFIIFADGACRGNPGPGGWASIVFDYTTNTVTELGGFAENATNNQMEMTAVGKAIRFIEGKKGKVVVYTDSKYVINGITKWIFGWKKNGWQKQDGSEVSNPEYWKRLSSLIDARSTSFEWIHVPGHSGVPLNERCDEIATSFALKKPVELYSGIINLYELTMNDSLKVLRRVKAEKVTLDLAQGKKVEQGYPVYLSFIDGILNRHKSWSECESRIRGVSKAKFKKCNSQLEESQTIEEWEASKN